MSRDVRQVQTDAEKTFHPKWQSGESKIIQVPADPDKQSAESEKRNRLCQ